MKIQLSDHFTYQKLIQFTLPTIVMMIFTSIYGVVDGFFVSNFVGKTPFAAVNFIWPYLMILGAFGFMFGTGGSAQVAKTLGEGHAERANSLFSLITYASMITGLVLMVIGLITVRPVASLLGAEGEMLEGCTLYGSILCMALPAYMLQWQFQSFFVTAEKPQLGLWVTVVAGVVNMVLDALFIAVFGWGIAGAAVATALSQVVGGVLPLFYFFRKNNSLLRLGKAKFEGRALLKTCTNGSSELLSNLSMSVVGMLYNVQLMNYAGEDGVAAYGVLMYVSMIFIALFLGYSIGSAPVIGYHFGAGHRDELRGLLKKSLVMTAVVSVCMVILGEVLAYPLSSIFVGYDKDLYNLTLRGFAIYSFSFLFAGIAIFASSFFTSLCNGLVSAVISFLRTLVFQVCAVLLLPLIFDIDGIWFALVVAELLAIVVAIVFLFAMRKKYGYGGGKLGLKPH